ncbi:MBL fold metallo-hydrolase [Tepidimonas taiwanensis]|uniref:MBL fold metallo-hydrolase n=1 Tax=Tepidimonas taiwanensis TaxID=307486 RepID=UPI000A832C59|nr:MBL fold metallo-hydrolase [Tepidimonas taiwanensis]
MDRRRFLGAGIAAAGALALGSAWSQQGTPNFGTPTLPTPGFRRVKVGAFEIIALNDGALRRPLGEEFVRNAPLEQVKAMLASQNLPTEYVDIPFTAFLAVTPAGRFLFDTGFADNGPPTTGRLRDNLAAAGFKPEDIDHVVISHFHGDHINGVRLKDGGLTFPRAKIHVPAPERRSGWTTRARLAHRRRCRALSRPFAVCSVASGPTGSCRSSPARNSPRASARKRPLATHRACASSPCARKGKASCTWPTRPTSRRCSCATRNGQ